MGIFLNIFTVDLWEKNFFDFLDPIQNLSLLIKLTCDEKVTKASLRQFYILKFDTRKFPWLEHNTSSS